MSKEQTETTEDNARPQAFLKAITARNFKSIVDQRVELGPLTVLVGKNNAGKSSLIDSILMRVQADREPWVDQLQLNGDIIGLGTFGQILREGAGEEVFRVGGEICLSGQGPSKQFITAGEHQEIVRQQEDNADFSGLRYMSMTNDRRLRWFRNSAVMEELQLLYSEFFTESADEARVGLFMRWWIDISEATDRKSVV